MWDFRTEVTSSGADLVGYDVAAADGRIGKLDGSSVEAGRVVVDTGPWVFGKERLQHVKYANRVCLPRRCT